MPQNKIKNYRKSESGNAFFIIMVSIVLFAGLMYTVSKGVRQGGQNLTEKQSEIIASDLIEYGQKLERAVQRVYSKGISENDISFENEVVAGYVNANCPTANTPCRVFSPRGGGVNWKNPDQNANDGTNWIITGGNNVDGIGTNASVSGNELIIMLGGVRSGVCTAINDQLGVTNPPPVDTAGAAFGLYTGSFSGFVIINGDPGPMELDGVRTGCFQDQVGGDLYFYHTLLER